MVIVIKKGSSAETVRQQYQEHKKGEKENEDLLKLCGSITLKKDPLELQKKWRDEWK